MVSKKQIDDFLGSGPIAMAGVSRNPKKFSYMAFRELKEKGLNVIPVNPSAVEILGVRAYNSVASLPPGVRSLVVMTKNERTVEVIKEAIIKGMRHIWIQQKSESRDALNELEGKDVNLITGECIMMFYKPTSIHSFHRFLKKLFGRLPS